MSTELRIVIKYRVPPKILYEALTNQEMICKFCQCQSKFEHKLEGEFSFYDGAITGKVQEIEENKKLILSWKFSNWPTAALVQMNFKEKAGNECQLTVIVKNCPERDIHNQTIDFDNIKAGFHAQIFDKIATFLGYPLNKDDSSDEDD